MAESHFIDLDGPVHYVDHGGDGPPLVLVHGLGGSHVNWLDVVGGLTASHHVYAIDLLGFGLTPPAGRKTTVQANCDLLGRFCREIAPEEPATLMGNSMGGLISLLLAQAEPHTVRALILVDPALPTIGLGAVSMDTFRLLVLPTIPGLGEAFMRRYYAATSPETQVEETFRLICADASRVSEETRVASLELARIRRDMEWAIPSFASAARSITGVLVRLGSFRRRVHRVACPTLLVHGTEDRIVSIESAEWLAKQRPDWDFERIGGVGHVPQIEAPEVFLDRVEGWLTQSQSRSS